MDQIQDQDLSWLVTFSAAKIIKNTYEPFGATQVKLQDEANVKLYSGSDVNAKPALTYTELIEAALRENGEMTVSEIYDWINQRFPYYKKNDGRWKNSIRHNLSINPQFRKGNKCNSGHYWTLNKDYDDEYKKWQSLKKTVKDDRKRKSVQRKEEDELEVATRSIMLNDETNDSASFSPESSFIHGSSDILESVADAKVQVEFINRDLTTAPLVIEDDIMDHSDPLLNDHLFFADMLELGFQPYELIDSKI